ncbi:hypothetical protein OEZ86_007251 [Tetradesmus obliquus]|nr:hypothetical protein OEZ86_007251 [Tetradesmus obliquus]
MLSQRLDLFGPELAQSALLQQRPPLQPGKSGNAQYTVAPHQVLSWYPRIVLFPAFFDKTTAAAVISMARPLLKPSKLGTAGLSEEEKANQPIRTSMGVFLNRAADPFGLLAALEDKIAAVTFFPPSHGEDFNVLRYSPGQHYHSHMDTFDARFVAQTDPGFGQRMATMILYLSDVEEGGETVFKREGKYGASGVQHEDSLTTCESSDFKYKPRAGDALLFFSMHPDRSIDPRALHGGCPVAAGSSEKWVATKWLHDKPINDWDGEADTA